MEVEKEKIVERATIEWENAINKLSEGADPVLVFLKLSCFDLRMAAEHIDCPYCRRHMLLEAGELEKVIRELERHGNEKHKHGLMDRLRSLITALRIVVMIALGGLRRAGVI